MHQCELCEWYWNGQCECPLDMTLMACFVALSKKKSKKNNS